MIYHFVTFVPDFKINIKHVYNKKKLFGEVGGGGLMTLIFGRARRTVKEDGQS